MFKFFAVLFVLCAFTSANLCGDALVARVKEACGAAHSDFLLSLPSKTIKKCNPLDECCKVSDGATKCTVEWLRANCC